MMPGRLRHSRTHRAAEDRRERRYLLCVQLHRAPASLADLRGIADVAHIPAGWRIAGIDRREYGHELWVTLSARRRLPAPRATHPCSTVVGAAP